MYKIITQEGRAKRGEFHTPHGVIQTPVFMNVGTLAAIKGALSTEDLEKIKFSTNPYSINRLTLLAGVAALESDSYYKENATVIYGLKSFPLF